MKRATDLLGSISGLLLASPLMVVVAVLIRIRMGGPVLFRQERAGKDGRPFVFYKFRTMTDQRGPDGRLLPDEERITRFGQTLRSLTIDELPSLWNVLKGEMSLVGPRPLFLDYVPLYSPRQRMRLNVRPGLTGWAVVKGRNALSWEERFELDVWYVSNWSYRLDLRILFATVATVVSRKGVNQEGHVTMRRFTGPEESGRESG